MLKLPFSQFFEYISPFVEALWTSGYICLRFQSQGELPPARNEFLRFTPAGFLVVSMVASHFCSTYMHWWGSSLGSILTLHHNVWQDKCSTKWAMSALHVISKLLLCEFLSKMDEIYITNLFCTRDQCAGTACACSGSFEPDCPMSWRRFHTSLVRNTSPSSPHWRRHSSRDGRWWTGSRSPPYVRV